MTDLKCSSLSKNVHQQNSSIKTNLNSISFCDLCRVLITSEIVYETHLKGKKHQTLLAAKIIKNPEYRNLTFQELSQNPIDAKTSTEENEKSTKILQCHLCHVSCNSQRMFDNHLKGKRHQLKSKKKTNVKKSLTSRKKLPSLMEINPMRNVLPFATQRPPLLQTPFEITRPSATFVSHPPPPKSFENEFNNFSSMTNRCETHRIEPSFQNQRQENPPFQMTSSWNQTFQYPSENYPNSYQEQTQWQCSNQQSYRPMQSFGRQSLPSNSIFHY